MTAAENLEDRMALLRRVSIFQNLPPARMPHLARCATEVGVKKGHAVFEEGETSSSLFVLTKGQAKIVIPALEKDRYLALAFVEPVSVVGEMAVLDGSPRSATLIALRPSAFLRIPAEPVKELFAHPSFIEGYARHLCSSLRRTNEQLRAICTLPLEQRLLWFLRQLANDRGEPRGSALFIRRPPSQANLAEMLGVSRRWVNLTMQSLVESRSIVRKDGGLLVPARPPRA
jgi:CRP-like cAMP-binding protein